MDLPTCSDPLIFASTFSCAAVSPRGHEGADFATDWRTRARRTQ